MNSNYAQSNGNKIIYLELCNVGDSENLYNSVFGIVFCVIGSFCSIYFAEFSNVYNFERIR